MRTDTLLHTYLAALLGPEPDHFWRSATAGRTPARASASITRVTSTAPLGSYAGSAHGPMSTLALPHGPISADPVMRYGTPGRCGPTATTALRLAGSSSTCPRRRSSCARVRQVRGTPSGCSTRRWTRTPSRSPTVGSRLRLVLTCAALIRCGSYGHRDAQLQAQPTRFRGARAHEPRSVARARRPGAAPRIPVSGHATTARERHARERPAATDRIGPLHPRAPGRRCAARSQDPLPLPRAIRR